MVFKSAPGPRRSVLERRSLSFAAAQGVGLVVMTKKEAVARGELTYAHLGASVVTGHFIQWLARGGTYGDEE